MLDFRDYTCLTCHDELETLAKHLKASIPRLSGCLAG
jgi:hypothetical protein